jgi:hypothetical protein
VVDGHDCVPEWIDEHGIRFKSTHRTKRQEFTALYARGSGAVTVGLPAGAREVEVFATRGFEYVPVRATGRVENDRVTVELVLRRWSNLEAQGWIAVDEHLHYDRMDAAADATWLRIPRGRRIDGRTFSCAERRHDARSVVAAARLWPEGACDG